MLRIQRGFLPFTVLLLLAPIAVLANDRALYLPNQTVATPDGALSLTSNPAGLSTANGWDFRLNFATSGANGTQRGSGWGLFLGTAPLGPLTFGFSAEHDADIATSPGLFAGTTLGGLGSLTTISPSTSPTNWYALQRLGVGFAIRASDHFSLGFTSRWIGNSTVRLDQSWEFGALLRPWSWISVGLRATNLGSDVTGFSATRVGVGLALRPFKGSDRLTIAGDMDWQLGSKLQEIKANALIRASRGISVGLEGMERLAGDRLEVDERRISLLLRLSLGHAGFDVGAGAVDRRLANQTDSNGGLASQFGLRISSDQLLSVRNHGPEVTRLVLKGSLSETQDGQGTHLGSLLLHLDWLAEQKATKILVLEADELDAKWAQIDELRAAIAKLRKNGKKVVFFSDTLGMRGLALAAACDRIVLTPAGMVSARGVAADFVGLRETLEKLGVVVEAVRFADHKTAPEALTNDEPSAALKNQLERAVTRSWHNFTESVALGRDLTPSGVEEILKNGAAFPEDALKAHLIDAVSTELDLPHLLHTWKWTDDEAPIPGFHRPNERTRTWGSVPRVAVVELSGSIADHQGGASLLGSTIGGTEMAEVIHHASKSHGIRALVARIDSPGGGIIGSEAMRQALLRVTEKEHLPVIASMGGVAASGGFWTSLGATTVFADPNTVTGSIGAFVLKPSLAGLWQKIGVHMSHFEAGPWANVTNLSTPWTPEEKAAVRMQLGRYYAMFLDITAKRRQLDPAIVEGLAGGRIWFGDEAVQLKLVDRTGGLLDALELAKTQGKIDPGDEQEIVFVPRLTLGQQIRRELLGAAVQENQQNLQAVMDTLKIAVGPWLDAALVEQLSAGPLALLPTMPDAHGP